MLDSTLMASAFNEWMSRFIRNPEQFLLEWQTATKYISERGEGKTPSYGEKCTAYLMGIIGELDKSP